MCKGRRRFWPGLFLVLIIMFTGWVEQVQSQEKYPTRPIDMICPHPPGGSVDTFGRLTAAYLNKKWGVPLNVINKPGGNGIPGTLELYHAAPNGYAMFVESQATSSVQGVGVENLPFKIMDRTFIGAICNNPIIVIVPATSPYKSLEDLIADCRKDPENFTWGSQGGISGQDLFQRQFFKAIGVDVLKTRPVMFKGGTGIVAATAGGNIKMGSSAYVGARAAAQAGTIRMLAVTRYRYPDLPEVPTFEELNYPMITYVNWNGIAGPPKLPSHIVDIWDNALKEMAKDPEFISYLTRAGQKPYYLNSREMIEYIKKEMEEIAGLFDIKK